MVRTHVHLFSILTVSALAGCMATKSEVDVEPLSKAETSTVGDRDDSADVALDLSTSEASMDAGEGRRAKRFEGMSSGVEVHGFSGSNSGRVGRTAPPAARMAPSPQGGLIGAKGIQMRAGGYGAGGTGLGGGGHRIEVTAGSEEYTDHGVNPFTLVDIDALSTFSIDVDTASYTMSRSHLNSGRLPEWEGVRVEEFINFFDYEYAAPDEGPFSVDMEAMSDPFRQGHHILRVGVQAKRFEPEARPPLHLTFLVDVSGSMSSAAKLGLAKKSMHTLVDSLGPADTVAMATYAGRVARILEPTEGSEQQVIHDAIDRLRSGGSTAMSSGIDLAYEMASESFEEGAENRVIILSDGDANVGASSWEAMLSQIKSHADAGVTLSTIGFGRGNYRDTLMEQLANKGDGNNFYVDSQKESDRIFGEKIGGTMITVARDTKIQVEFNEDAVTAYRLLGYENRDIADKDFRNDRVDAGEVGSGHSVTALYEVILADDAATDLATVRVRWEAPGADKAATEASFDFDSSDLRSFTSQASDSLKLAYAAATFAEVLRQSPYAAEVDLTALGEMVDAVSLGKRAEELSRLISTADRLGAMEKQADWVAGR
jgi:Ca-activated chloride channel family protein